MFPDDPNDPNYRHDHDRSESHDADPLGFWRGLLRGLAIMAGAFAVSVLLYYGLRSSGYTLPKLH